jgi:hypothetical protein
VDCGDRERDIDQALVAVSPVSGGSVDAMYIVDAYDQGRLTADALTRAVKAAEASSLDEVAWGLTYPDLVGTIAPFLKGIWRTSTGHVCPEIGTRLIGHIGFRPDVRRAPMPERLHTDAADMEGRGLHDHVSA